MFRSVALESSAMDEGIAFVPLVRRIYMEAIEKGASPLGWSELGFWKT